MKKILINGKNGQLGQTFQNNVSIFKNYELYFVDRNEFDLESYKSIENCIKKYNPDIIVHLAAYTDVNGCEMNPKQAYLINSFGTRNVAQLCNKYNIELVYISTDYVFDGKKTSAYTEFDMENPINIYGDSKYQGERFIKQLCNKFYIVRTSWVYSEFKTNFLKTMLSLSQKNKELKVVDDQIGNPTYTLELVKMVYEVIDSSLYGIYHATGKESVTWYEFANRIFKRANISIKTIPVSEKEFGSITKRPKNSVLSSFFEFKNRNSLDENIDTVLKKINKLE